MLRGIWLARVHVPIGLGAFVLFATAAIGQDDGRPMGLLEFLWLAAPALILLPRHRFPLTVHLLVVPLVWIYYATGHPDGPAALYVLVAVFNLTVRRGPVLAVSATAAQLVAGLLVGLLTDRDVVLDGELALAVAWSGMAIAAGAALTFRRNTMAARREQAKERTRRQAEEERLAIAREVHDVVAHSLAMINVQAGVGAHVADRRPEDAKQALLSIKEASRAALVDLRATLAVLRSGEGKAPAPSLRRLADLTGAATAAGLPVRVEGEPGDLPAPVDSAAYRIVQESLTNAVRHASGATGVTVRFARAGGSVEVVVADDGNGPADPDPGTGNGLRGMRERAEALGGTLTADAGAGGGFRVRAVLPVRGEDE
jgi:signal transduction histidine kinase